MDSSARQVRFVSSFLSHRSKRWDPKQLRWNVRWRVVMTMIVKLSWSLFDIMLLLLFITYIYIWVIIIFKVILTIMFLYTKMPVLWLGDWYTTFGDLQLMDRGEILSSESWIAKWRSFRFFWGSNESSVYARVAPLWLLQPIFEMWNFRMRRKHPPLVDHFPNERNPAIFSTSMFLYPNV